MTRWRVENRKIMSYFIYCALCCSLGLLWLLTWQVSWWVCSTLEVRWSPSWRRVQVWICVRCFLEWVSSSCDFKVCQMKFQKNLLSQSLSMSCNTCTYLVCGFKMSLDLNLNVLNSLFFHQTLYLHMEIFDRHVHTTVFQVEHCLQQQTNKRW